jgi:hypothetical protein
LRKWLRQQSKYFYAAGFHAVAKRWGKCINVVGGYVEKFYFQIRISYVLNPFEVRLLTFLRMLDSLELNYGCISGQLDIRSSLIRCVVASPKIVRKGCRGWPFLLQFQNDSEEGEKIQITTKLNSVPIHLIVLASCNMNKQRHICLCQ